MCAATPSAFLGSTAPGHSVVRATACPVSGGSMAQFGAKFRMIRVILWRSFRQTMP